MAVDSRLYTAGECPQGQVRQSPSCGHPALHKAMNALEDRRAKVLCGPSGPWLLISQCCVAILGPWLLTAASRAHLPPGLRQRPSCLVGGALILQAWSADKSCHEAKHVGMSEPLHSCRTFRPSCCLCRVLCCCSCMLRRVCSFQGSILELHSDMHVSPCPLQSS